VKIIKTLAHFGFISMLVTTHMKQRKVLGRQHAVLSNELYRCARVEFVQGRVNLQLEYVDAILGHRQECVVTLQMMVFWVHFCGQLWIDYFFKIWIEI
jgi:hypothetical protein